MDAALEEIEFLALSANRIAVLSAVSEGVQTRSELATRTGASQPTLSRILRDFEARNWIRTVEGGYEATATGQLVADGITDLVATMATEGKLRGIVPWLPDAITFDLTHLREAEITVPTRTKPNAPAQRSTELLGGGEQVRIVSHAFNEQGLSAIHEATVGGEQSFEGVLSESAVAAITAEPDLRRQLRDIVTAERGAVRVADGEIPVAVSITDETVHLLLRNDDGVLQAVVVTDEPTVREWATGVFEEYWAAGTPLSVTDL